MRFRTVNGEEGNFTLAICNIEQIGAGAPDGLTHALSLLDPGTSAPTSLSGLSAGRHVTLACADTYGNFGDENSPTHEDVARILEFGRTLMDGTPAPRVIVHCHAGFSRSPGAAALLIAQAAPSMPAAEVIRTTSILRAGSWPNLRMIEFGDGLLHRNGALVLALRARYARVCRRYPAALAMLRKLGREREIPHLEDKDRSTLLIPGQVD